MVYLIAGLHPVPHLFSPFSSIHVTLTLMYDDNQKLSEVQETWKNTLFFDDLSPHCDLDLKDRN